MVCLIKKRIQRRAVGKVRWAIQSGLLIRSQVCDECGSKNYVDAHHSDYSRPLDVVWLCRSCHKRLHSKDRSSQVYWVFEVTGGKKIEEKEMGLKFITTNIEHLDTQADIDNDRNEAFDRYSHQFELKSPIFGRLHNYA